MHYVTDLVKRFSALHATHLPAIIDTANGAAGPALQAIITHLGITGIRFINAEPSVIPAHASDPSNPANLRELMALTTQQRCIGLALDGDGDRLGVITEQGQHLAGDDIMALLAPRILQKHPGAHVVYDLKTSSRLTRTITTHGGHGHFAACGHPFIQQAMQQHNALLGGEVSGHLFFNDRYFGFDDGIYAALRMLEHLHESSTNLHEQFLALPHTTVAPEQRIACENPTKVIERITMAAQRITGAQLITTDGIRIELADGWLLVRASRTEPVISVRCEGENQEIIQLQQQLIN